VPQLAEGIRRHGHLGQQAAHFPGNDGGNLGPLNGSRELNPAGLFLQSRPSIIYAGSNEIQCNILARNVLELP